MSIKVTRFRTVAAAALLAFALPAAPASAQDSGQDRGGDASPSAKAPQTSQKQKYSDAEIRKFADAAMAVNKAFENHDDIKKARKAAVKALQNVGMKPTKYNEINKAVKNNKDLRERYFKIMRDKMKK